MSTITLPYGTANYFRDGKFTGSLSLAQSELSRMGAEVDFDTNASGTVVTIDHTGLGEVQGERKDSASEALKSAVEAAYAKATAPEPVVETEEPVAEVDEDNDRVEGLLSDVNLNDPESVLDAANLAVKVLARLVQAAGRFV